jgi:hypothetical protein
MNERRHVFLIGGGRGMNDGERTTISGAGPGTR